MQKTNTQLILITAIAFSMIIGFFSFISFYEWYQVKVIAEPEYISGYNFGENESRGWHYISKEKYARMSLLQGLSLLLLVIFTVFAGIKKNIYLLLIAALLFTALFFFWRWYLTMPVRPF